MENKAHALAAGAFVLVAATLLVALAVWLTRDTGVRLIYEVSTRDAVTGLLPQASVRYRGIKVGKVVAIGFDRKVPGNVLLQIAVDKDTPVTRSTYATLGFQGVTGIAFVQLDDSGEATELLQAPEGQVARIPMRPGLVGQFGEQGARVMKSLEETSQRINQLLAPENQKVLMGTLGSLGQAAASLPPVMQEARGALQSFRAASAGMVDSADEAKRTAIEFGRLAQRVQQPGGALDQLTQGATVLTATGQLMQQETLPRLNRAADDAAQAARRVSRLADTLEDNPQALIFGNRSVGPGPGEPGFASPERKP